MNYREFKQYIKEKVQSTAAAGNAVSAVNKYMDFKGKEDTHRIGKDLGQWNDQERDAFKDFLIKVKHNNERSAGVCLSVFNKALSLYAETEDIDKILATKVFIDVVSFRMRQLNLTKEELYRRIGVPTSKRSKPDKWFGPAIDPERLEYYKNCYKRNIPFAEDPYVAKLEEVLGLEISQYEGDEFIPGDLARILPTGFELRDTAQSYQGYDSYALKWEDVEKENPLLIDQIKLYRIFKTVDELDLKIPFQTTYDPTARRLVINPNPPIDTDTGNLLSMKRNFKWETKDDFCSSDVDRPRLLMLFMGYLVREKNMAVKDIHILHFIDVDLVRGYRDFLLRRSHSTAEAMEELKNQFPSKSEFSKVATSGWITFVRAIVDLTANDGGYLRQRRDIIQDEILQLVEVEAYEPININGQAAFNRRVTMKPIPSGERWEKFISQENQKLRDLMNHYTNIVSRVKPKKKKLQKILALPRPEIVHLEVVARVNREIDIFKQNKVYNEWFLCLLRDRMLVAATATFGQRASSVLSSRLSHYNKILGQGSDFHINEMDQQIWIHLPKVRQKNNKEFRRKINSIFPLTNYIEEYLKYAHPWFILRQPKRKHRLVFCPYGSRTTDKAMEAMTSEQRQEAVARDNASDRDGLRKAMINLTKHFSEYEIPVSPHEIRMIQQETAKKFAREHGISPELAAKFAAFAILDSEEVAKEHYSEEQFTAVQRDLDRMYAELRSMFRAKYPHLANYILDPEGTPQGLLEFKGTPETLKNSEKIIAVNDRDNLENKEQRKAERRSVSAAAAFLKATGDNIKSMSLDDILLEIEMANLSKDDRDLVIRHFKRNKSSLGST